MSEELDLLCGFPSMEELNKYLNKYVIHEVTSDIYIQKSNELIAHISKTKKLYGPTNESIKYSKAQLIHFVMRLLAWYKEEEDAEVDVDVFIVYVMQFMDANNINFQNESKKYMELSLR